jgi:hypothetical protein
MMMNSGLLPAAEFRNLRIFRILTAGRLGRHVCYAGFREGARIAIHLIRLTHIRPRGPAVRLRKMRRLRLLGHISDGKLAAVP